MKKIRYLLVSKDSDKKQNNDLLIISYCIIHLFIIQKEQKKKEMVRSWKLIKTIFFMKDEIEERSVQIIDSNLRMEGYDNIKVWVNENCTAYWKKSQEWRIELNEKQRWDEK